MAQVIGLNPQQEGQRALDAVMKLLEYDAQAANKFWGKGHSAAEIGEDVLMKLYPLQTMRTRSGRPDPFLSAIPPAAATAMHLGREMATPLNTGLSLIPAFQAMRAMRAARKPAPSVSPATTVPVTTGSPVPGAPSPGGVSRRDLLKGLALAPLIYGGAKTLERLLPKEVEPIEKSWHAARPERRVGSQEPHIAGDRAGDEELRRAGMGVDYDPVTGKPVWDYKTGKSHPDTYKAPMQLAGKYERVIDDQILGGKFRPTGVYSVFEPGVKMNKAFDGLERMRKAGQYEGRYAKLIDERMKMKDLSKQYDKMVSQAEKTRFKWPPEGWHGKLDRIDKLGVQMQEQAERVWQEWSKLQQ